MLKGRNSEQKLNFCTDDADAAKGPRSGMWTRITWRKSSPAALSPSDHIAFPAVRHGHGSPWQQTRPEFHSIAAIMPRERIEPQHTKSSNMPEQMTEGR